MSATDKTKLDGIAANANNYTLPTASSTTKGGVKVGATLSISGEVLNLKSGFPKGTYTKVQIDDYGRVSSGSTLSASDIPSISWSKITSGKPTTISGYGITDAYTKTETDNKVEALQSLLDSMFERVYDSNNKLIRIHSNVTISSSGDLVAGGDSEGGGTSGGAYTQLEWNAIKALTQSESGLLASAYSVKEAYNELNTAIEALAGKATNVKFTQTIKSGKQIGTISIDGKSTSLYAPAAYAWSEVTGKPSFATVATSGSYTDLANKPTIASLMGSTAIGGTSSYLYWNGSAWATKALGSNAFTSISKVSQLTNDSGYITGITKAMVEGVLTGNITSHTHSYLPLSGGTMSNTNVVTNLNADLLDGYHKNEILRSTINPTSVISLNDVVTIGIDFTSWDYAHHNVNNQPGGDGASSAASVVSFGTDYPFQIYSDYNDTSYLYYRSFYSNTGWKAWRQFAFIDSNVASASKWKTPRTITLTGSVTGSVSIDGSANVSLATTTNHTHNYAGSSSAGGSANSALTLLYNNKFDTTYGRYAIFQQSSYISDFPHDGWFNSIKMLHNNSSGYFTEIAMSFTGEDGMWRRALRNGAQVGWYKILDSGNIESYAVKYDNGSSVDTARHSIGYDNGSHGSISLPRAGGYISFGHDTYGGQLLGTPNGLALYYRGISNNAFSDWKQIAFLDSNVASATKLANSRTIWGQSFDGTGNVSGALTGVTNINSSLYINSSGNVLIGTATDYSSGKLQINGGATLVGYMTSGSVSKIADLGRNGLVVSTDPHRRNWGMAFWTEGDGKGYIQQQAFISNASTYALCLNPFGGNVGIGTNSPSYKLDVVGAIHATTDITASGHAKVNSLKTHYICIECDNSGNSSGRTSEINNYDGNIYLQHDTSHNCFICTGGGNVGIGTNSPSYKLHIVGTAYATENIIAAGDLTAGSDIRYKDKIQDLRLSVHDIALAPAFTYKWNNREDDALVHIGSSAQYWLNTDAKDAVYYDKQNDFYHLNYASLALCNTIILARGMETQEEKIARLEDRIKELEDKLRQYGCNR